MGTKVCIQFYGKSSECDYEIFFFLNCFISEHIPIFVLIFLLFL